MMFRDNRYKKHIYHILKGKIFSCEGKANGIPRVFM